MTAQEAKNWKKRMHSMMEREAAQAFREAKSGYARYRPGMTADELKAVLDFRERDPEGAGLPKMSEVKAEIRRFGGDSFDRELKKARRDDLVRLLCRALDHTPRRWVDRRSPDAPRKYHRFGLTFHYEGDYPKPEYREDMGGRELRAMLELHPDVKMTASQIKAELRDRASHAKRSGSRDELLKRLREELAESSFGTYGAGRTYTTVECWADERDALQAKFDAERAEWQRELETNPEWKDLAALSAASKERASAEQKKADEAKEKAEAEHARVASTRPWRCQAYDPNNTTMEKMEVLWREHHSSSPGGGGNGLSFAYSGRRIPPPEAFAQVLVDWRMNKCKYGHHLLAYLEIGYGQLDFLGGFRSMATHPYITKDGLKEIHGRQTTSLNASLNYAVDALRKDVARWAQYRFRHGL